MRGGRSFLILTVLALGLGAYIYFVEMKRDPAAADDETKREKVFAVESGKIEEVEVRAASGDVTTVKKSGDTWQISAPEMLEADTTEVGGLVSSLESVERQRTIDENPPSAKPFGLEPPRISIAFKVAGESGPRRLLVGNRTPTGADLYARVDGEPRVFLISAYLEDSLNKTTFNLREKSVLKFDRDAVDSLSLEPAGAKPMVFARKGNEWRFTAPIDAKADFSAVDGLISRVFQARLKSIVGPDAAGDMKKHGLDKPQATATFGAGSTRATLALGAKQDETSIFARDLSRPLVFTVESSLLDDLKRPPDDLRAKDVFEFRSFSATGLDLALNGQAVTFSKEKPAGGDQSTAVETWKQTKPAAKDLDQNKINDLLTTLSNLRGEKFADKALTTGDELIVVARFGDAGSPKEERVTLRKSGDIVHAIIPGEPGAAIVNMADYDKVVSLLKELSGIK